MESVNQVKRPKSVHEPVLLAEALTYLHIKNPAYAGRQARYIDATVGAGGHTLEIIKSGGLVLGFDADPEMLSLARKQIVKARLAEDAAIEGLATLIHANFRDIGSEAAQRGFGSVAGILFDLGISSRHYDSDTRGFSFRSLSAPLDMRLSPEQGVTAADLLNSLRADQLAELFMVTMGRGEARRLTHKVLENRPFNKVEDLVRLTGTKKSGQRVHPATKPFLALRIAVNSELDTIQVGLNQAVHLLANKGRLVVISFHSGEDRETKTCFKKFEEQGLGSEITDEPVVPTEAEVQVNPRARSAKMRVFERRI